MEAQHLAKNVVASPEVLRNPRRQLDPRLDETELLTEMTLMPEAPVLTPQAKERRCFALDPNIDESELIDETVTHVLVMSGCRVMNFQEPSSGVEGHNIDAVVAWHTTQTPVIYARVQSTHATDTPLASHRRHRIDSC